MVTEGTYPQSFGGVSVWCDQIVRGLPGYDFQICAISVSGRESPAWVLPEHVTVTHVPLWPIPILAARRPQLRHRAARRAAALVEKLLVALVTEPASATGAVAGTLREMVELTIESRSDPVAPALRSEAAVRVLISAWRRRAAAEGWPVMSVHDALVTMEVLEHWMRPLLWRPPIADVTHAVTNGLAALVCLSARWRHGTPMLLTEHGVYLRERYLSFSSDGYAWPTKTVLLRFLRHVCTTAYLEADLVTPGNRYNRRWEEHGGAAPERIQTVYNGVEPNQFPPAGPEPDVPTVTWAGRIDPIKDLETLIRAFVLIHQEMPESRLRIFGGAPKGNEGYLERCRKLASELGIGDAVTFEGRVEEIRDAYAAGHVVALSSISEGFPYTLIEAMASGRATVSTDVGGVLEAVADTGFVVPPRDPAAMARACLRLLRDDAFRHRLAVAARSRAIENFTVEKACEAFDAIYSGLAADGRVRVSPAGGTIAMAPLDATPVEAKPVVPKQDGPKPVDPRQGGPKPVDPRQDGPKPVDQRQTGPKSAATRQGGPKPGAAKPVLVPSAGDGRRPAGIATVASLPRQRS